jgi:threonyl-tRNA synthetase
VRVVPVSEKVNAYAELVGKKLTEAGLRHTIDMRNEKLGAKIRHGELDKVPALLVVGEKEQAAGTVSLRRRGSGDAGSRDLSALIAEMNELVASRAPSWTSGAAAAAAAQ